jgi:hypothetical protein
MKQGKGKGKGESKGKVVSVLFLTAPRHEGVFGNGGIAPRIP